MSSTLSVKIRFPKATIGGADTCGTKATYQRQNRASTSNAYESVLPPISVARIRLSRLIARQCDKSDASANEHSPLREKAITKAQPGDGFLRKLRALGEACF